MGFSEGGILAAHNANAFDGRCIFIAGGRESAVQGSALSGLFGRVTAAWICSTFTGAICFLLNGHRGVEAALMRRFRK